MDFPHESASRAESPSSGERNGLATGREFSIAASVVVAKSSKACNAPHFAPSHLLSVSFHGLFHRFQMTLWMRDFEMDSRTL